MDTVIIYSESYNALYQDGVRVQQAKPDYLDAETMAILFPDAALYEVPEDVYEAVVGGVGYPEALADFPLADCEKIR